MEMSGVVSEMENKCIAKFSSVAALVFTGQHLYIELIVVTRLWHLCNNSCKVNVTLNLFQFSLI